MPGYAVFLYKSGHGWVEAQMTVSKYTPKYADIKVTLPYAKKRCTGAVVFNLQAFCGSVVNMVQTTQSNY